MGDRWLKQNDFFFMCCPMKMKEKQKTAITQNQICIHKIAFLFVIFYICIYSVEFINLTKTNVYIKKIDYIEYLNATISLFSL